MVLLFQLLSFSGLLVSAACFPLRISQALSLIKINPYHGLCHRWWDSQTHILLVRLKRTARGMRGPASAGACQLIKHSIITTIKITRRKRTCPGCSHNSHSWVEMIKPKQVISSVLNFFFVRFWNDLHVCQTCNLHPCPSLSIPSLKWNTETLSSHSERITANI